MHPHPIAKRSVLLALILVAIAACSPAAASAPATYVEVSAESLRTTDEIPPPTGEIVLKVGGDIAKRNVGPSVSLDIDTVERMGLVKYRVHDPWLDADHDFTGVLLADLLDTVGGSPAATSIRLVALDDYEVEIAIADARRWPILLATQMDGRPMPIQDKGPTRIVFPYDQFAEIDRLKYKDLWIWSVESIAVR